MDDTWRKYIYGWNVEDVERAKVSEAVSTSGSHLLLLSGLRTPDAGGFPHSNLIKTSGSHLSSCQEAFPVQTGELTKKLKKLVDIAR